MKSVWYQMPFLMGLTWIVSCKDKDREKAPAPTPAEITIIAQDLWEVRDEVIVRKDTGIVWNSDKIEMLTPTPILRDKSDPVRDPPPPLPSPSYSVEVFVFQCGGLVRMHGPLAEKLYKEMTPFVPCKTFLDVRYQETFRVVYRDGEEVARQSLGREVIDAKLQKQ